MTTAEDTLIAISNAARDRMLDVGLTTPAAQALDRIARDLRALAILGEEMPLTMDDAEHAFLWLGQDLESDDSATLARRATCREIAELARGARKEFVGGADPVRLADVLDRVAAAAERWTGPDLEAFAATCAREAAELRRCVNVI